MAEILFLAHRIPYPPDKGDKIRSWHIFRHLAARHTVHLGCFIDDPDDRRHVPRLAALCAGSHFAPLPPWRGRLGSLAALATGTALTFGHFRSRGLAAWVARTHRTRPIAAQFVYSSAMAPCAERIAGFAGPRVVDFVDVDSDKWAQYAAAAQGPRRWLYAREARLLAAAERRIAGNAAASLFVSEAEAALFRARAGLPEARVHALANGVDTDHFDPALPFEDPYPPGGPVLAFTGAMDYRANIDAVTWFAEAVLPHLQRAVPDARFWIVGARPAPAVHRLAGRPGVTVTGRVPDTRPYLAHAALAVAPLRLARGVQNKVLEAMAMARPVLATPQAFEGIEAAPGTELAVAEGAEAFAAAAAGLLADRHDGGRRLGARARQRVVESYGWDGRLRLLDDILG